MLFNADEYPAYWPDVKQDKAGRYMLAGWELPNTAGDMIQPAVAEKEKPYDFWKYRFDPILWREYSEGHNADQSALDQQLRLIERRKAGWRPK